MGTCSPLPPSPSFLTALHAHTFIEVNRQHTMFTILILLSIATKNTEDMCEGASKQSPDPKNSIADCNSEIIGSTSVDTLHVLVYKQRHDFFILQSVCTLNSRF